MANPKSKKEQQSSRNVRSYKGEMVPSVELNEGQTFEGVFQGMKVIQLVDQNTKKEKDVMR